ncbi:hypothetical protein QBZ16_003296 [Prototheca wickerhamii]|uniref:Uncharacterized protein n=1 Tax=Prototheca wickerhamii TaxID=3111 RepID=A0AAD9IH98_PROWI|nr:hypothetical protein QBZ16_003296 [Prototheca wickerhamii]
MQPEEGLTHEELALILGEPPTEEVLQEEGDAAEEPAAGSAASAPAALPQALVDALARADIQAVDRGSEHVRSGALFCLFTLFFSQPCQPRVKIYLTLEHAAALQEYAAFLVTQGASRHREEAAVLREIRFNLASGFKGLGGRRLESLYDAYAAALSGVWDAAGRADQGAARPQSIADLGLGKLLAEYAGAKELECGLLVRGGRRLRRGARPRDRAPKPRAPPRDGALAGLPGAARRVMERDAARARDMHRRAATWMPLLAGPEGAVADMPDLPGLPPSQSLVSSQARQSSAGRAGSGAKGAAWTPAGTVVSPKARRAAKRPASVASVAWPAKAAPRSLQGRDGSTAPSPVPVVSSPDFEALARDAADLAALAAQALEEDDESETSRSEGDGGAGEESEEEEEDYDIDL